MKTCSFKLSAVAISVLVGFSGAALAETSWPVKDVASLSKDAQGAYSGGGAVFIGGSDLTINKDTLTGGYWESINPETNGFNQLVTSSGYKGYLTPSLPSLPGDVNYVIDEDYQRAVHGERQASVGGDKNTYSVPTGVINGLRMGSEESRYVKTQSVTLYQRDASGNIQYEKDADGNFRVDSNGNRIPLTVSKVVELDQNSDVYVRPVTSVGGAVGLQDSAIYSKVKSLTSDIAAVTMSGNLQEHNANNRQRDVFVVKNTTINNTLDEDAVVHSPTGNGSGDETTFTTRPWATGLAINANSVDYQVDGQNNLVPGSGATLRHDVAATPNVVLDNAQITARNLAAVRKDDHTWHHQEDYNYLGDTKSTAVAISGSGLFVAIANQSTLTGGVNNAGKSLTLAGHANRVDVDNSTLNGAVLIGHDGYTPVLRVAVAKDKNGDYVATGAFTSDHTLLNREHNGTTLNVSNNSVVNGDIRASGETRYDIQLVDVTNADAPVEMSRAEVLASNSANAIYGNAVGSAAQAFLANANHAMTPVAINFDHSTLNGAVGGITNVRQPDGTLIASWNPDLTMKDGSVWNAAATANGRNSVVSDVHDLNLSSSTLNLVNLETNRPTLGGQGRNEDLGSARVVVHNNLTQDKDSDGRYLTSLIHVGKSVVNPLLDVGGQYAFGSMQVKGSASGNYQLAIANSGVEPYVKDGYLADSGTGYTEAHSFVNYLDKGSDATFTGRTELGVYQYDVSDELNDTVHNEHNVYFKNNGHLSNSASLAQSLQASQVSIANMETDALHQRLNASRHANDEGGVWASYFGGSEHNKTNSGAAYRVRTNGMMLGVDTRLDAQKGGNWLAGLAFSSGNSDVNTMNSSGDIDSYGMQFYVSRRWDNGVFVDTQAQFNHFSNDARVHMLDGQRAMADYSGNGYGLGMKLGYTWEQEGFFAEPYLQATGRTFDGAKYALSNGMVVNGDDYKSVQGELGVDLGYTFALDSSSYVKPYVHLAGLNEFADGNTMRLNNVTVDNSIDGAAFQIGLGTEVKLMENIGGYAGFNYTTGSDIERPWQANVGLSYTW
ncbi:autotransporter outer membrane beta-barrel domain-containing protein [Pantoea sp. 1.19]|uniref:autotransporter outer membrane beta-barrel domain-containing protein n=1 Tax=Pantoea sp. 1.19 TaxID=1925589 RepID=UPI000948C500|nr:autotransporter outer membrane beta-barrel domain-containing protein [Pantoea sp. 1.19]